MTNPATEPKTIPTITPGDWVIPVYVEGMETIWASRRRTSDDKVRFNNETNDPEIVCTLGDVSGGREFRENSWIGPEEVVDIGAILKERGSTAEVDGTGYIKCLNRRPVDLGLY